MTTTLGVSGLSARDRKRIKRLQMLLYGTFKTGKSIVAHSMPRTRTIDFDDGMQSIEWAIKQGIIDKGLDEIVYETILPEGKRDKDMLDRALSKVSEWVEEEDIPEDEWEDYCMKKHGVVYPQKWDTLIVDSMTPHNEGAIALALSENARLNLSKSWGAWGNRPLMGRPMRIQDWGSASNLTLQFVTELKILPKNLVLVAHEYYNTDDEGNLVAVQPMLIGGARQSVPALFDEVWYCETSGTRQKPVFQFQTTPGNGKHCGSRLGCLDPVEKADFMAIKAKIAKFYEVDEEWLWSAGHGSAAVEAAERESIEEEGIRV